MQLGNAIKMVRQKAFLSQEAFSSELSVSVSTINRWETGKVKPNLTAMKKIKDFCEKHSQLFIIQLVKLKFCVLSILLWD